MKTYLADPAVEYEEMASSNPLVDVYFRFHNPYRRPIIAIPDGMNDLQFFYGASQPRPEVLFTGTALKGRERLFPISDWVFGVRFSPGVKINFVNLAKAADFMISLYSLPLFQRIWKHISENGSFCQQIAFFETMALYHIDQSLHELTQYLLRRARHMGPYDTLDTLIGETGYSHVHVNRIFKSDMGFTLKFYIDMLRIQKAIVGLEGRNVSSLQAFSERMGFYDQAHFTKTFKKYTTFTPKEFMKYTGVS